MQILPLSVALGNLFHAPSHTLWEPLGVQYWKRRKDDKKRKYWSGQGEKAVGGEEVGVG